MNRSKSAVDYTWVRSSEEGLPSACCARCGRTDDLHRLGDFTLCTDCYYIYGSCCMEFGSDDLTHYADG